jgi:release factor glutamine methyltransferase
MAGAHPGSWTILEVLRWAAAYFQDKGVTEPRASAEVLLAHALGVSRLDLYLRYDQPLSPEELATFKALVVRRREGEPTAYLTGHKEFWSLDFKVTPAVLIPRPETETLVQAVLEVFKKTENRNQKTGYQGLEVGVGSGAVVIALARELPETSWVALDLSWPALVVARDNARRHQVAPRLHLVQADLLSALRPEARFALLVANLPYVPDPVWRQLPGEIKDFEPQEALRGGADGLALLRPLARQAHLHLQPGGWLALEVAGGQAPEVMALLRETRTYDRVETVRDYLSIERVVRARRADGD